MFNCGARRDPESGNNAACVVHVDGGSVHVLVAPDTLNSVRNTFVNFPRDAGDHVVFEGSWPQDDGEPPETLWQRHDDDAPTPAVARTDDNTVSPRVLGNGEIVGLWLGREDSGGAHELTLLHADNSFTTLAAVDVSDIGIGCTTHVIGEETSGALNQEQRDRRQPFSRCLHGLRSWRHRDVFFGGLMQPPPHEAWGPHPLPQLRSANHPE